MNKIGRFGVGFNVVYHLKDAPQLLSNFKDYLIFDPLCKHFPDLEVNDPGFLIRNAQETLTNSIFSDVLSGFQVNGVNLANSTLFRLPLRQSESDISKSVKVHEIQQWLRDFNKDCHNILLFLKNIKKVGFYEYDETNVLKPFNEIGREMSVADMNGRKTFIRSLESLSSYNLQQIVNNTINYKLSIRNVQSNEIFEYLLFDKIGFDNDLMSTAELNRLAWMNAEKDKNDKFLPLASIAIQLNGKKDSTHKLFNYLPLDQDSPFKFHINAYWALQRENRTHIYEHGLSDKNVNAKIAAWFTDWNFYLINFIGKHLFNTYYIFG